MISSQGYGLVRARRTDLKTSFKFWEILVYLLNGN